ncbi:TetR/AcrR family transcriptional regulator [Pontimicrobium aquaticum]|uniref:TetR/AcrR family transcriptional regulator n=1 Tax=Pontimicrobium aquaticum TaxID=2565367 RepID=A0A4U0EVL1_9FLAO|nr:TetR/AcrR family transcriptional regulator [Pontimicrobium aquaticum]TJY35951.1 TetR/AcrR family transcriptional regulator [Pontimicrobium aquaticum]
MKKLGVRERIIATASDLFYNQGYNQTGINQIISEAGVAKASMYQHFRSKEDIAVAYLTARHTMWMGKLKECVSIQNTPKGKVIGCFDYLMEWLKEVNFRGCGWQNIITDLPDSHEKVRNQAVHHKNDVRDWIHKLLKDENEYTDIEAEQLGDEVLILIEGAIILSQIQKDEWPIKVAKNACAKLLA